MHIKHSHKSRKPELSKPSHIDIICLVGSIAAIFLCYFAHIAALAQPNDPQVIAEHSAETDFTVMSMVDVSVQQPDNSLQFEDVLHSFDVPADMEANSGFKSFMDYRKITSTSSKQYRLQQEAETDPETGIRTLNGLYMIALGTYYAQEAGETFKITLSDGTVFYAVTGDIKSDAHTDPLHQHRNGNIVEFIVDVNCISDMCRKTGDMSWAGFEGQIAAIERVYAA